MMNSSLLLPSPKRQSFSFLYTLFATLFLPSVLSFLAGIWEQKLHALALNMTCFGLNFAVLVWVFRRFLLESLQHFRQHYPKILLTALGGLLAYLPATFLLSRAIALFAPDFYNRNDSSLALMAEESYILTAFATVFLVPVAEECMFRAGIFGSIYRRNPKLAFVISTLFFSLVHIDDYFGMISGNALFLSFLQYLPAGILLSAAYAISGSIFAPILMHSAINALGMLALR